MPSISELLLPEFDNEMACTRRTLERIPDDKAEYKPHDKSTSLIKLANHVGGLPGFVSMILTEELLDVSKPNPARPPAATNSAERLTQFDAGAVAGRELLATTTDEAFGASWKLCSGDYVIFKGMKYQAMRSFFFNHMIHHRAQLGVYLRLNDCSVPSVYGPSADERPAPAV